MEHTIGIIGSSGKIGKAVSEILSEKYKVIGGQRHKENNILNDNFSYRFLDIFDDDSLKSFCSLCTVIVNCAGPSYVIKDRAARFAGMFNVKYIDLSGDMLFDEKYKYLAEKNSVFLAGTGYVAGLSAIIPVYYIKKYFDNVESISCWQGSREICSRNSIVDIILSSISNSGYSGCFYYDKSVRKETIDTQMRKDIIGFPESVFIKPYISNEMKAMAEFNNVKELHWYNAIPDSEISDIAENIFSDKNISDISADSAVIDNYLKIYNAVANSRPIWNVITYEISGYKNGEVINKRIICHVKSGYKVCAVIASLAAESIIKKSVCGIHWGFEVIDGETALNRLLECNAVEDIICNDFSGENSEIEEDIL